MSQAVSKVTRFCVAFMVIINSMQVWALPNFSATNQSVVWEQRADEIRVSFQLRQDATLVNIQVINGRGSIVYNEQLFNLRAGVGRWEWDGYVRRNQPLEQGLYRVIFSTQFINGVTERDEIQLRVTERKIIPGREQRGYAAPVIVPYQPSYKTLGNISILRRIDDDRDQYNSETRINLGYKDKGDNFTLDANIGYFRNTDGIENADGSYGRAQRFWDNGELDLVYRRTLGFFNDPLRLFADFRSTNDKLGARFKHRFSSGEFVALGYEGQGAANGKEKGVAARWKGKLNNSLFYGVSVTDSGIRTRSTNKVSNRAYAVDIDWRATNNNRVTGQYAITDTDDESTENSINGSGEGGRITWYYQGREGLRTSLGYLNLSSDYNALLSDPGNQVRNGVAGPELTIDYFLPVASEAGLKDLAIGMRAFSYDGKDENSNVKQTELFAQASVQSIRVTGNFRRRVEDGDVQTTLQISEFHNWTHTWRGGFQYSMIDTAGITSQRALLSANTGSLEHYKRVGLELVRRSGDGVLDGPVDEVSLLANGRSGNVLYETIVRYSNNDIDNDVNVFAQLGYEREYLHRYKFLVFLAMGDRSTSQIAKRVEAGIQLRF